HAAIAGVRRDDVAVFADHVALYDEMKQVTWHASIPHSGDFAAKNKANINTPDQFTKFLSKCDLACENKCLVFIKQDDPRSVARLAAVIAGLEKTHAKKILHLIGNLARLGNNGRLTFQPRRTQLLKRWRRQPQPTNHCQTNPLHGTVPQSRISKRLDPLCIRIPQPMGYQAPFMDNSYPPHYYGHPPPPMGAQFGYPPSQVSPGQLGGHLYMLAHPPMFASTCTRKLNQSSRRDHRSIFASSIEGGCRSRTVPQIYIRQPLAGSSPKGFKKAHAQALTLRIGRFEHHLKKTRANNNKA
ncbi:hypothetical protein MJO29_012100, partial [Puccinia striiformis f. sp. tritici]